MRIPNVSNIALVFHFVIILITKVFMGHPFIAVSEIITSFSTKLL